MRKFVSILSLWCTLLPGLLLGQGKVYLRASEGQKPFTYQLYNGSGSLVETRQSSKNEEEFTAPGFGYQWRVSDNTGAFKTGAIDEVTHRIMNKAIRLKGAYYGSVGEQVQELQKFAAGQQPGFNTFSGHFHANVYFRTEA